MSFKKSTATFSKAAAIALAAGLVTVPQANAQEVKTTDMTVVMGCNVQIKKSELSWFAQKAVGGAEGVYNGGTSKYNMIRFTPKVTAPTEVEQGKQFDYVVELGKVGAPAKIALANVRGADQMNVWLDLPKNATLDEVVLSGGDSNVTYQHDKANNRLRLFQAGGDDLSKWTRSNEAQWKNGGLKTKQEGDLYLVDFPKITLKMTPTGAPGDTVAPSLDDTDPKAFSPKAFAQLYASANAVGVDANAFVRCGLGGEDTTPDNGRANAKAQTDPFPAVKITASKPKPQNETNDPKAKGAVTITEGDTLPAAKDQVADFAKLPAGTTAAWASEHKAVGDNQQGKITVTYPDKTTDTVNVTVNVKKKADNVVYDPKAKGAVTITEGDTLPAAKDQVADFAKLPAGTTAAWASEHKTVGDNQQGKITVTYPDKTTDTVNVTVNVKKKADNVVYDPKAKGAVTINKGEALPAARDQIADFAKLPAGTTAAWTTEHTEAGDNQKGQITVTYPDQTTDTVDVTVNVKTQAELNDPKAAGDVNITQGDALPNAAEQIADFASLPKGTTAEWSTEHAEAGDGQDGIIAINYSDGSQDTVRVKVNVKAAYVPHAKVNPTRVDVDAEIADDTAKAQIVDAADAPAGTTFEWKAKPDTATAGETRGVVTVTVPGKDPVDVRVPYLVVGTEVIFVPEAVADVQAVELGTSAEEPQKYIINADEAPEGTTFAWKGGKAPKFTETGRVVGTVVVTVPEEGSAEREIRFEVTSSYVPQAQDGVTEVEVGEEIADDAAKGHIANADKAPEGTVFAWGTKPDTATAGEKTATVLVTVPGQPAKAVDVTYRVNAPYVAEPKTEATQVEINAEIADDAAKAQIANADDAPEGTTFVWKTKPATDKVGAATGVVTVTVPGAEPFDVEVSYEVTSSYEPQAKAEATEVEANATVADDAAKAQIANADDAPEGTTFVWKTKPTTDKAGAATGVVTVTVPGAEPKDITVNYTVAAEEQPTPTDPESPEPTDPTDPTPTDPTDPTPTDPEPTDPTPTDPTDPEPTDPTPNPTDPTTPTTPETTERKLVFERVGGERIYTEGSVLNLWSNGQKVSVVADANGAFALPEGLDDIQTVTISGNGDFEEVTYTVDLKKKTIKKEMTGAEIAGTVIGSILAAVGLFGSVVQLSGVAKLNTDLQKRLGIYNPQLAHQVEQAGPAVAGALGLAGLGLVIGLLVPKSADKVVVKFGGEDFTFTGYTSSKAK